MVVTGLGEKIQVGRADPPLLSDQLPGDDPEGPGRGARDRDLPSPQSQGSATSLGVSFLWKERPKDLVNSTWGVGWVGSTEVGELPAARAGHL